MKKQTSVVFGQLCLLFALLPPALLFLSFLLQLLDLLLIAWTAAFLADLFLPILVAFYHASQLPFKQGNVDEFVGKVSCLVISEVWESQRSSAHFLPKNQVCVCVDCFLDGSMTSAP